MNFKHGELEHSNTLNDMPLAGHQTTRAPDDDDDSDDNHYETSMDKLFATFTQVKDNYDSSRSSEMSEESHEEEEGIFDDLTPDEEEKPLEDQDQPQEADQPQEPDEEAEEVVKSKPSEEDESSEDTQPEESEPAEPVEAPVVQEGFNTPEPVEKKKCPNSAPVREEEEMVEKTEFMDNTFWESPMKMSLDDILAENDYI